MTLLLHCFHRERIEDMKLTYARTLLLLIVLTSMGCGRNKANEEPSPQTLLVTPQSQDCHILEREFDIDCDSEQPEQEDQQPPEKKPKKKSNIKKRNERKQAQTKRRYPHKYKSRGRTFPNEGSWRKSARQVDDLLDRVVWSPEKKRSARIIDDFDIILYVNVAPRNSRTRDHSSAQRMQVFAREGRSFYRTHLWKISSGKPDGDKRIATYTGVFKLDQHRMYQEYKSKQFEDANMYETMFLYHIYKDGKNTGVAIHGTEGKRRRLGRRDSGGCIRLDRRNSRCLYNTIRQDSNTDCLGLGFYSLWGKVPSVNAKSSEMDPEYLTKGGLNWDGSRVLVAIIDDSRDNVRSSLLRRSSSRRRKRDSSQSDFLRWF